MPRRLVGERTAAPEGRRLMRMTAAVTKQHVWPQTSWCPNRALP
jgi:hypothetical protein